MREESYKEEKMNLLNMPLGSIEAEIPHKVPSAVVEGSKKKKVKVKKNKEKSHSIGMDEDEDVADNEKGPTEE